MLEDDDDWTPAVSAALKRVARSLRRGRTHKYEKYYNDPIGFCRNELGFDPWELPAELAVLPGQHQLASQADLIRAVGECDRVACKSGHKIGKLLHDDTTIPTPNGWRRHGDLRIGDQVFDERGQPCNVVNVIPWTDRPLMRVTFEDGSHVDADEHHEWVVHTRESRKRTWKRAVTLETKQLAARVMVLNGRSPDGTPRQIPNFTVDLPDPIELPDAELLLDPYLLGVWLGDGSAGAPNVTTADPEIEQAFQTAGFETKRYAGDRGKAWCVAIGTTQAGSPLRTALRELGVLGNKHVPEAYLWASVPQRLALLQGLMDTDGTVSSKGTVEFTNTNERLARAVVHLARSLGVKARIHERRATLRGVDCGPVWDVGWCSPLPVFRLERKRARLRTTWAHKATAHRRVAIVSVEPLPGRVNAQCITVDSPSHLYLCGESMLPTHNSLTAVALALWFVATRQGARVLMTAPTFHQVKNILWKEMRNLFREKGLAKKFGAEVPLDPATGLQLPDGNEIIGLSTKTKENLAGLSAPHLFFIVDEASGFPDELWEVLSSGNAAGGAKIFVISNPTRTTGWFHELFRRKLKGWRLFTISSETTPNAVSGEARIPGLAQAKFIDEMRELHGPDYKTDAVYMVRVMGMFPIQGSDCIFNVTMLEQANKRWAPALPIADTHDTLSLGVDVARFGDDDSVIWPARGLYAYEPEEHHGLDGPQLAEKVIARAKALRRGYERVKVVADGLGVGTSLVDALKYSEPVQQGWMYLVDLNVGASPDVSFDELEHYVNLRSQLWFSAQAWVKQGGALPPSDRADQELLCATYSFDPRNRKKVLKKDVMREILGFSPDYADALCMATYNGARGHIIDYGYQAASDPRHPDPPPPVTDANWGEDKTGDGGSLPFL